MKERRGGDEREAVCVCLLADQCSAGLFSGRGPVAWLRCGDTPGVVIRLPRPVSAANLGGTDGDQQALSSVSKVSLFSRRS